MAYTSTSQIIAQNIRNTEHLSWYIIPILAFVLYVYAEEIHKKNWNLIFAGLVFWGMDWINEIINALVFHFSNYAPIWGTPGHSAYIILAGLNIEIMFMFAIAGIVWGKLLSDNPKDKILGINNRWFVALLGTSFSVFTEILLNKVGMLTWEYAWWNTSAPWLIFIFGYLTFFIVSFWIYDMKSLKRKIRFTLALYAVIFIAMIGLISLGWI